MFEEYEKTKRKQFSQMQAIRDYGLGLLFLTLGIFFLFRDKLNIPINSRLGEAGLLDKFFGGLCILYGIWRVYRGYKKNYFK